jgi:hypothetical protein
MATEAARLERKESTGRKKETHLTHTGLLMEGMWITSELSVIHREHGCRAFDVKICRNSWL